MKESEHRRFGFRISNTARGYRETGTDDRVLRRESCRRQSAHADPRHRRNHLQNAPRHPAVYKNRHSYGICFRALPRRFAQGSRGGRQSSHGGEHRRASGYGAGRRNRNRRRWPHRNQTGDVRRCHERPERCPECGGRHRKHSALDCGPARIGAPEPGSRSHDPGGILRGRWRERTAALRRACAATCWSCRPFRR